MLRAGKGALIALALLSVMWYGGCASVPGDQSLPAHVSPRVLYELGLSQLAAGEYPEARVTLEQAVARDPRRATFRNALGWVYLQLGRLPQAVEAFRETVKLNPEFPDAHNNLGVALAQSGRWEEAIASFERVLTFPAYNSPELVYQNLGWAYYNLGRDQEAEAVLAAALRLDPRLPVTHHTLGLVREKSGRVQEARDAYRQVLELVPAGSDMGRRARAQLQALDERTR